MTPVEFDLLNFYFLGPISASQLSFPVPPAQPWRFRAFVSHPLRQKGSLHRIPESLRLEKSSRVTKSNLSPKAERREEVREENSPLNLWLWNKNQGWFVAVGDPIVGVMLFRPGYIFVEEKSSSTKMEFLMKEGFHLVLMEGRNNNVEKKKKKKTQKK